MSFWRELRRRNVVKVGATYAIVAWLIAQVVSVIDKPMGLPGWFNTAVLVFLAVGFPVALLLAWAYEVTPEGIKRTKQVPLAESIAHFTGQKLNYLVTGLLVLVVASIAFDTYVMRRQAPEMSPQNVAEAGSEAGASREVIAERLPNSVAVLPFDNLSTDPEHEYFAVGVHEEILNQLAKVKSLSVISRSSVLRYASDRPPIPEIAAALNVGTVMEGSVRYAGNRILVTVQLIDAATDSHMWSDAYPGDVSDLSTIFALQADIAMNVANALRAKLTPSERASIERPPTNVPEAYEYYLAASVASRGGTLEGLTRGLGLIVAALELDDDFALAWMRKSAIHSALVQRVPLARIADEQDEAEMAIRRAIELAPDSGEAYAELAYALSQQGRLVEAELAYRSASERGIVNLGAAAYGVLLLGAGNLIKARDVHLASREIDPLNPTLRGFLIASHGLVGEVGAAVEEYNRGNVLYGAWPFGREFMLWLHLGAGDTAAALEFLSGSEIDAIAAANLDAPRESLAALRRLREEPGNANQNALRSIAMWVAYFGDAELAVDIMEDVIAANSQNVFFFWYPQMREARRLPAFRKIMREAGFVEYWQTCGWNDFCSPVGDDDFECR